MDQNLVTYIAAFVVNSNLPLQLQVLQNTRGYGLCFSYVYQLPTKLLTFLFTVCFQFELRNLISKFSLHLLKINLNTHQYHFPAMLLVQQRKTRSPGMRGNKQRSTLKPYDYAEFLVVQNVLLDLLSFVLDFKGELKSM